MRARAAIPAASIRAAASLLLSAICGVASAAGPSPPPRLILQITVDQLRGDLVTRFLDEMGEGGFRYLSNRGVVFHDAHHAHANTETIAGHTTLATGAHPSAHGMVANVWFDRRRGRLVYNIEDARYPLLTSGVDVNTGTEIDPTQKTAASSGRSPANILVSTFGDELSLFTNGRAKIFGVSVKDRAAVSMAGHTGKAFWFSKKTGEFVTSRFYYDRYPDWVASWNAARPAQRYAGESWSLLHERSSYVYGDSDDEPWEVDFRGYGRVFPHPFGAGDGAYFNTRLTLSPVGDALTLDFTKSLIENESIGADDVTDYLSVSFSSTDYVGHFFGPSSLEAEENLLRLDQTLAALLKLVDEKVGLDQTLIVLASDHGIAEVPGRLRRLGTPAEYIDSKHWEDEARRAASNLGLGAGQALIRKYYHPYVYLDHEVMQEKGIDAAEAASALAAELGKLDGVSLAVPSAAIASGQLADSEVGRAISYNYNDARSGDIYVVFEPNTFINDLGGLPVASNHGSPWRYDSFVPVIFAGAGLVHDDVFRRIETVDVAPTLAAWIGAKPPSGSVGKLLGEVLDQRKMAGDQE